MKTSLSQLELIQRYTACIVWLLGPTVQYTVHCHKANNIFVINYEMWQQQRK